MLDFDGDPIQAIVRVTPGSSSCTKKDAGSLPLQIEDSTTIAASNPTDPTEVRVFGFSQCHWSCDGFAELQDGHIVPDLKHANGSRFSDTKRIFDGIGKDIVQQSWNGFNSSVLCIGGNGSGKSFTLFGNASNKGLITAIGSELFKNLKEKDKSSGTATPTNGSFAEVKLTMMEISDDNKIRDLFASATSSGTKYAKSVVKVREHPKRGFYVEGLRSIIVTSGDEIQQRLEEGQTTRAIHSTAFNLMRNRSTVIVGVSLVQKSRNTKGEELTVSALVDFYDIPVSGTSLLNKESHPQHLHSKRQFSNNTLNVGRSSTSLEEHILSSSTLDYHFTLLVSALGNNSSVTYANSSVTKLLERSLSGNSKTYVIAHCISHETKYESSLSTLCLADKLQRLRTHPIINEEFTNKLVRELKHENEQLKKMLGSGDWEKNEFFAGSDKLELLKKNGETAEELKRQMIEDVKSQVKDNEKEIKALNQSLDDKIKLAKLDKSQDYSQVFKKIETDKKHKPFLLNLAADAQLSGKLIHFICPGQNALGSGKLQVKVVGGVDNFIGVNGPGIHELHCTISNNGKDNKTSIKPNGADCLVKINGKQIFYESPLFHNDRVVLGGSQIWLFQNPREPWAEKTVIASSKIHFQFAQEELALKSLFYEKLTTSYGTVSPSLRSQVLLLSPLVEDGNAMCDDLENGLVFNLATIYDVNKMVGKDVHDVSEEEQIPELFVKCSIPKEEASFLLEPKEYLKKYEIIKNSFIQSQEDGFIGSLASGLKNSEELLFDINLEVVTIGHGLVSLNPLVHLIQFEDDVVILDSETLSPIGSIRMEVCPCTEFFEKLNTQPFLTNSLDLVSKPLYFTLRVGGADSIAGKYKDIFCKYKIHTEPPTITGKLDSKANSFTARNLSSSSYKYERRFTIESVTPKLVESLENDLMVFTFYGKQKPKKMRNQFKLEYNKNAVDMKKSALGSFQRQKGELIVAQHVGERIQQKLNNFQTLLDLSEDYSQSSVPIEYIHRLINAKHQKDAGECLSDFKEEFAPPPEIQPANKIKQTTYQKVSEICAIM